MLLSSPDYGEESVVLLVVVGGTYFQITHVQDFWVQRGKTFSQNVRENENVSSKCS